MNFLYRVIAIPEKLTAFAAAGFLWLMVQAVNWFSNLINVDLSSLPLQGLAVAIAVIFAQFLKAVMEAYIPENWHTGINTFLEWLTSVVVGTFLWQAL